MTIDVPLAESKTFDFYEAWRWAGHWKSEAIFRGLHPSSQLGSAVERLEKMTLLTSRTERKGAPTL